MEQLREAFATLSDVLVDELDAIRTDAARRWELAEAHLNKHAQSIKSVKAELALLRDEVRTGQQGLGARAGALEVAAEATHAASAQLAQELGAVGSAGELLRLHFEQEREEAGQGGSALEARLGRAIDELGGQLQQQREETDSALSALDRDVTAARELADSIQSASASALDTHRDKLLQCATAIEKQWGTGKELVQKCDSLAATQVLVQQQLQDRLDSSRKENQRWRTSLEDSLRSTTQDLASLKLAGAGAYSRAGNEPFPDRHQREVRRMLDERDEAARREITTLGRAIHSLADSLNVASPLVIGRA